MQYRLIRSMLAFLFLFIIASSALMMGAVASQKPAQPLGAEDNSVPVTYVSSPPPAHQYTITLITGDTLYVSRQGAGPWVVAVKEVPRPGQHAVFKTFTDSKLGTYVVPLDVLGLLSTVLDPMFFNLDYLVAHHLTDEQAPILSAIVQYTSNAPMTNRWNPSLVRSSPLSIIHSQAVSISKNHAAEFGRSFYQQDAMQTLAGIQKIWLDRVFTAADDQSGPLIGADIARRILGYDGTGIKIAIIDTGIDQTHPDFLFPNGTSKIIQNTDFECSVQPIIPSACDSTTNDLFGHGTHVAGIAAGTGAASAGLYTGIAPGAALMNMKVLNRFGYGYDSWIIAGMQSAALGLNGTKADVISMSLGDGVTDGSDPMSQAVNTLTASTGVPFVIAAGNAGSNYRTVGAPGAATAAITVAASNKVEPVSIAYFSSRGPRAVDFSIKPDITAPGLSIISTCSSTAVVLTCPSGSNYLTLSGTSMATPHVAGSAALLIQAARKAGLTLTPAQVKDLLQSSSRILQPAAGQPDVDIYSQGAGLVRIDRAITSNITFNRAEISLGLVPFNTTATLQATFQVANRGTLSQSITLTYQMFDVPSNLSPLSTGTSYSNLVSLDKTSFTLTPGSTITVTLTVNAAGAPFQKLWTFFSGRIIATSSTGEQEHAIFGFTKEGQHQTVKIKGIMPDGTSVGGQPNAFFSFWDILDGFGLRNFFLGFDSNGQATLSMPLSNYTILMNLYLIPTLQYYRVTALNVNVGQSPVSLVLDARTTGRVTLNLQANPSATAGIQQDDHFSWIGPGTGAVSMSDFLINGNWNIFGENPDKIQTGTIWSHDRWQRTIPPYTNSTVLYDLAITRQALGPIVDTVTSQNLTATTGVAQERFHADKTGTMYIGRMDAPTEFNPGALFLFLYPINVPLLRTEYQQASQDIFREAVEPTLSNFWFDTAFTTSYLGGPFLGKIWAPGESLTESWLEQPVHPTLTSAVRTGNTLSLTGFEVLDTFGHRGSHLSNEGFSFTLKAYINGILNFTGSDLSCTPPNPIFSTTCPTNIPLPSSTATIKLQLQMNPDPSWATLAKTTGTNITFTTSATKQGPIPLPNSRYSIKGLNLLNQVATTQTSTMIFITIPLTTPAGAPFNATAASVQASIDDGTTWFNAKFLTVSSGSLFAKILIPTSGTGPFYVSLLVHAQSSDGTTLDQQIIRAVQLVPGASPPP